MNYFRQTLLWVLGLSLILVNFSGASAETANVGVFRYDEPITLRVSIFDRGTTGQTPVDDNFWTDWCKENFGVPRNIILEYVSIPRSEEITKLNTLMAAASAPDICFTYTESVVSNYVQQGGLVDLSAYIEQYGPHIQAYLGEEILKLGIFSGKQYAIPAKRVLTADENMFIRADWIKKVGLSMPTTLDEFYEVLVAFRDQNPGGATDVIPYSANVDIDYCFNPLLMSFKTDLSEKTLATIPQLLQPGYKEGVRYLNQLYHEGLISPDFALDKDASKTWSEVSSGRSGGYGQNYEHAIRVTPGIMTTLRENDPDAVLLPLQCFQNQDGEYPRSCYTASGILNIVPSFSQHPEAAVMYLDWLCQSDVIFFLQNGVEGVHHILNEQAVPVVQDVKDERRYNSFQNLDMTLMTNGQDLNNPGLNVTAQALSFPGFEDLYNQYYTVANTDTYPRIFHFDVPMQEDAKYGAALDMKEDEITIRAIMADPDEFDELYDRLTEEYMAEGGQAVMEEKIAAYDAMMNH